MASTTPATIGTTMGAAGPDSDDTMPAIAPTVESPTALQMVYQTKIIMKNTVLHVPIRISSGSNIQPIDQCHNRRLEFFTLQILRQKQRQLEQQSNER